MSSVCVVEPGYCLRKDGGLLSIEKAGEKKTLPLETIEDVTLVSAAQISSGLIQDLCRRSVPVVWMTCSGEYLGGLQNVKAVDVEKHIRQVKLLWQKDLYNRMAKKVVIAKAHNQIVLLRQHNRRLESEKITASIKAMYAILKNVERCDDYQKLMGYEGIISREYFKGFSLLLPEGFQFSQRTRRPPKDEVNAMLSFGYNVLYNAIFTDVCMSGLHPYVGFFHRIKKGHAALVSDLMEEWRTILVDSVVLNLVKRCIVAKDMFRWAGDGCYLEKKGLKIFWEAFNKKMASKVDYLENGSTYRDLLKSQVRQYVSVILNEDDEYYRPVEGR